MEQIAVTSTLKKIQELIDNNLGDTGRLEHIIDFLNNEKPLYTTDRIYLENKLNSKIIIEPKKTIPEEDNTPQQIKTLIDTGKGDPGRLEHIIDMLKKEKTFYQSDKQYLENNFGITIIEKQKKVEKKIRTKTIPKLEEKIKEIMPKDEVSKNKNPELEKIYKKLKKEEEKINIQNKESEEIDIQKLKLNKLIEERENNNEKIIKERQLL